MDRRFEYLKGNGKDTDLRPSWEKTPPTYLECLKKIYEAPDNITSLDLDKEFFQQLKRVIRKTAHSRKY